METHPMLDILRITVEELLMAALHIEKRNFGGAFTEFVTSSCKLCNKLLWSLRSLLQTLRSLSQSLHQAPGAYYKVLRSLFQTLELCIKLQEFRTKLSKYTWRAPGATQLDSLFFWGPSHIAAGLPPARGSPALPSSLASTLHPPPTTASTLASPLAAPLAAFSFCCSPLAARLLVLLVAWGELF